MPIMNGIEAAPHIFQKLPTVFIILFTQYAAEAMEVPPVKSELTQLSTKAKLPPTSFLPSMLSLTLNDLFLRGGLLQRSFLAKRSQPL
jgi:hypothetical protein